MFALFGGKIWKCESTSLTSHHQINNMSNIITYQQGLDAYSENDKAICAAIVHRFGELGVTEVELTNDEEFRFQGADEMVKELRMTPSVIKEGVVVDVIAQNDFDFEQNEYSLFDDTLSQLDKLQILTILEDRVREKLEIK